MAKAQGAQSAVGACRFAETPIVDNEAPPRRGPAGPIAEHAAEQILTCAKTASTGVDAPLG
jgi:hypothetical protein